MISTQKVTLTKAGLDCVWDAMRQVGFSEQELAGQPELLAWVARENGIQDFRNLQAGTSIKLPNVAAKSLVLAEVTAAPDQFAAALRSVELDRNDWLRKAAAGANAPQLIGVRVNVLPSEVPYDAKVADSVRFAPQADHAKVTKQMGEQTLTYSWTQGAVYRKVADKDGGGERLVTSGSANDIYVTEFNEFATRDWERTVVFAPSGNLGMHYLSVLRTEHGVSGRDQAFAGASLETWDLQGNGVISLDTLMNRTETALLVNEVATQLSRQGRVHKSALAGHLNNSFALYQEGDKLCLKLLVPDHLYRGDAAKGYVSEFVFDVTKSTALRDYRAR